MGTTYTGGFQNGNKKENDLKKFTLFLFFELNFIQSFAFFANFKRTNRAKIFILKTKITNPINIF